MKKGLIADFNFPRGHKQLNLCLISALFQITDIDVITQGDYYNEHGKLMDNIFKDIGSSSKSNGMVGNRISSLKNILLTHRLIKWSEYDYVLFNTFETTVFGIVRGLINNNNLYIIHHKNTDELSNGIKKFIFKSYMNKVNHIVFEPFIKDYLVKDIKVDSKKVFILPHPLNILKVNGIQKDNKVCIGISNSNNQDIVDRILELEEYSGLFSKSNVKMVLKTDKNCPQSNNIKTVTGYLPKEEYDSYFQNCSHVILPFSYNYRYRTSGTLMDALANNKIVIGNNIPLIRSYAKRFPNICHVFNDEREIPKIIESTSPLSNEAKVEFEKFMQSNCNHAIVKRLGNIFVG